MGKMWTKKELWEHLRTNLTDKAGTYSAAVVVAALYKKLSGEFPKIGLSGAQAECAESILPLLPLPEAVKHSCMDCGNNESTNARCCYGETYNNCGKWILRKSHPLPKQEAGYCECQDKGYSKNSNYCSLCNKPVKPEEQKAELPERLDVMDLLVCEYGNTDRMLDHIQTLGNQINAILDYLKLREG